jgi:hypothetical protein
VPLDIADPHAILSLAGIITMTPGTLSAELSPDRRYLLVHAFNVDDEAALIAQIKSRYEAPLKEMGLLEPCSDYKKGFPKWKFTRRKHAFFPPPHCYTNNHLFIDSSP